MFYLLIILLQMKLIREISDLNKAINKEKEFGFVPTMGGLHRGHEALIKASKKKCKKTIVSIFVNPTQFNNKDDYKNYPKNLSKDLKILKKLNVDLVYLPPVNQIYKEKNLAKIILRKPQKILCVKFRKGHFEGVLDVLNRFVKLLSPKIMFMGEKDYQQFFLTKNFIEKSYQTKVISCKTTRSSNRVALSTRNELLDKSDLKICSIVAKELFSIKRIIVSNPNNAKDFIKILKKKIIDKFDIQIEYMECRNLINLSTNLHNMPFKLFIAYYINGVRLIDNF